MTISLFCGGLCYVTAVVYGVGRSELRELEQRLQQAEDAAKALRRELEVTRKQLSDQVL
jgi:hypothetical protein